MTYRLTPRHNRPNWWAAKRCWMMGGRENYSSNPFSVSFVLTVSSLHGEKCDRSLHHLAHLFLLSSCCCLSVLSTSCVEFSIDIILMLLWHDETKLILTLHNGVQPPQHGTPPTRGNPACNINSWWRWGSVGNRADVWRTLCSIPTYVLGFNYSGTKSHVLFFWTFSWIFLSLSLFLN